MKTHYVAAIIMMTVPSRPCGSLFPAWCLSPLWHLGTVGQGKQVFGSLGGQEKHEADAVTLLCWVWGGEGGRKDGGCESL